MIPFKILCVQLVRSQFSSFILKAMIGSAIHSVGPICVSLQAHARSEDPGGSAHLRRTPVSSQSEGENGSSDGGRLINNIQGKEASVKFKSRHPVAELPCGRSAPRQRVSD